MFYSETESGIAVANAVVSPVSVADLVDKICAEIDAAGCWTVTGSSGDKYATSVENTLGGSYQIKVRLYNGGAGNSIYCAMYDPVGSAWDMWSLSKPKLDYVAAHNYRVIWSPYWFMVLDESAPTSGFGFLYCGVPKVPDHISDTITDCGFVIGSSENSLYSWRNTSTAYNPDCCQLWVNSTRVAPSRFSIGPAQKLWRSYSANVYIITHWWDTPGTYSVDDFLLVSDTGYQALDPTVVGYAYDMAVVYKSFNSDVTEDWDGNRWQCISPNSNPSYFVLRGPTP